MSKHSIRIGSLSRLSASRSSSSASTRRSRCCSATTASDVERDARVLRSPARRVAASRRVRARAPRRASRAARRGSRSSAVVSPDARRHDDLRRHRRGRAVVLEAERLEQASGPGRRRSRGGSRGGRPSCRRGAGRPAPPRGRRRPRCRSRRSCRRPPCPPPAARRDAGREEPVAVASRLLEALVGGGVAHPPLQLPQDRLRVPGQELDHAVDDLPVVLLRDVARRTAPCSGRCGSRGTGCPSAGPASAPRRAGTGRRG